MTDAGWDIPGIPRDPAATPDSATPDSASPDSACPEPAVPESAGAGSCPRSGPAAGPAAPRRGRSSRPLVSVSVLDPAGSPGAFPRSPAGGQDGISPDGISPDGPASSTTSPDGTSPDGAACGGTACGGTGSGDDGPAGASPGGSSPASTSPGGTSAGGTSAGGTSAGGGASGTAAAGGAGGDSPPDGSGADGAAPAPGGGGFAGGAAEALGVLAGVLEFLAHDDVSAWPEGLQADCLRALAVAEARQAAVHARVLAAFSVPGGGLHGDGHASPRMWLSWQARATRGAAAGQVSWMRRLAAHPRIAAALAGGAVSLSWAALLAGWSEALPAGHRDDADRILLAGVAAGAGLADLAAAAAELAARHAAPDRDDDGFEDRRVRLGTTFGGTGRVDGDLTARCAAAVTAVLDSLSARRGAEDTRTLGQRYHDGLEEACLRLLAAGTLPERAGQPVRLEVTLTLDQLTAGGSGSPAGPGAACDAVLQPVITGHLDHDLLDRLTRTGTADKDSTGTGTGTGTGGDGCGGDPQAASDQRDDIVARAVALLSGPAGHAALLRAGLPGLPGAAISLPLDIAGTLDTIPVHLRRAVRARDRHCRFPGCDLPPAACDVHHIRHRQDGGRHTLTNLTLLCRFHHLIAIHRWGWTITLHPDGTTTAVSPDHTKTLHSHPPPQMAA